MSLLKHCHTGRIIASWSSSPLKHCHTGRIPTYRINHVRTETLSYLRGVVVHQHIV